MYTFWIVLSCLKFVVYYVFGLFLTYLDITKIVLKMQIAIKYTIIKIPDNYTCCREKLFR